MTTHAKGYTIKEILNQNPELIVGTFSPQIQDLLELFEHAREICKRFVIGGDMPQATIALAVPVMNAKGQSLINFPVFDVQQQWIQKKDPIITKFMKDAIKGQLNLKSSESTVGTAMSFLTGTTSGQLSKSTYKHLREDVNKCKNKTWLRLSSPHTRYSDCYTQSNEQMTPVCNLVKPIMLEKGALFAAVGIDCMEEPNPQELEHLFPYPRKFTSPFSRYLLVILYTLRSAPRETKGPTESYETTVALGYPRASSWSSLLTAH